MRRRGFLRRSDRARPTIGRAAGARARAGRVAHNVALLLGLLAVPSVARSQRADPLPCPDCEPRPRRPRAATAEATAALLAPWVWHMAHGKDFVRVSPGTWWTNLTRRWEWDGNSFDVNQWGHPYHGSLYFNAFRTNGYGFWTSATAAAVGSFLWECCAETKPMSQNDMVNTTLGGAAVGELLYRASGLVLDNAATGRERVGREIAATLIDPVRGIGRLLRGETSGRAANARDARPDSLAGVLDVGWIRLCGEGRPARDGAVARLALAFGDPLRDAARAPFSHFVATVELTTLADARLLRVATSGTLGGAALRDGPRAAHVAAAMLDFTYVKTADYELGAQAVRVGALGRWRVAPGITMRADAFVRGVALGAVSSGLPLAARPATPPSSRDYDYGPGLGADASVALVVHRRAGVRAEYAPTWLHTVDGAAADHVLHTALVEARARVARRASIGAEWRLMRRHSAYPGGAIAHSTTPELRVFASSALGRWTP